MLKEAVGAEMGSEKTRPRASRSVAGCNCILIGSSAKRSTESPIWGKSILPLATPIASVDRGFLHSWHWHAFDELDASAGCHLKVRVADEYL